MAYTKQTWNTGDTITAQKLNHMEDGIASSGGVGYDITFNETTNRTNIIFTADGASFEELSNGDEKKAVLIINANSEGFEYYPSVSFNTDLEEEIAFTFAYGVDPVSTRLFKIKSNGDYTDEIYYADGSASEITTGSYTYANGHYTFTVNRQSG